MIVLFATPVLAHAQTASGTLSNSPSGEIPAPELAVGDTWEYRRTDGFTGIVRSQRTLTVTEIGADKITLISRRPEGQSLKIIQTKQLNTIVVGEGKSARRFTPYYPLFSFPLVPGKTWRSDVEYPNRRFRAVKASVNGKVDGWENVSVPAGTFEALKLTIRADYMVANNPILKGQWTESCWYVPSVRRCAKRTYRDWNWDYNESFVDELVKVEVRR
jgi:hypothetical protein